MSKLAAVHTGQPTQGHGTVPNGKQLKPNFGGPEAAGTIPNGKAEAASTRTIEDIDNELQALSAIPPAAINPRSAHSAAAATVTAAWLSLSATELETRTYFKSIPVPSGLEMLAKMRKQCDLAAETLQQRMDLGNLEHCTGCGKTLEQVRKTQWIMMGSDVDSDTGVPVPYRFCSPMCVRERNREKMLPPDQRNKLRADGLEEGEIR